MLILYFDVGKSVIMGLEVGIWYRCWGWEMGGWGSGGGTHWTESLMVFSTDIGLSNCQPKTVP